MKTCTSAHTWGRNSWSKASGSLDRNLQGSHTDQGETEGEPPCCHTRLLSLTPRLHRHVPQRHLHPSWNSFPPPLFFWASSSASWFSCHTLGWSQKRTCYCRPPLSASSSAPSHTCRGVYFPKIYISEIFCTNRPKWLIPLLLFPGLLLFFIQGTHLRMMEASVNVTFDLEQRALHWTLHGSNLEWYLLK